MRYNFISLQVFIATAEEENLTRAAERCHLAPSAVSKRLRELEEQAGVPLLVRYPRGMGLTPAGESLLHHARQLLRAMQKMDDELSEYAQGVKGHVRVHAVISALSQQLPADFARFMQRYPLIKLDIEECVGDAIVSALLDGRADVGVFMGQTPARGLQTFPYGSDELVLAVSRAHELAARPQVRFEETLGFEFVGPHAESSLNALMHKQANALGRRVMQRTHVSSFDCMARMVAENLGIALLPRTLLQSYTTFLDLQCIPLTDAWARREIVVGIRSVDSLSYAARALVEQLCPDDNSGHRRPDHE